MPYETHTLNSLVTHTHTHTHVGRDRSAGRRRSSRAPATTVKNKREKKQRITYDDVVRSKYVHKLAVYRQCACTRRYNGSGRNSKFTVVYGSPTPAGRRRVYTVLHQCYFGKRLLPVRVHAHNCRWDNKRELGDLREK